LTEKCRFFLLDLNELQSQSRSTIRLWGLDEEGKRILIDGTQIEPHFYYLPKEEVDIASTRDKLLESRTSFQKITHVDTEKKIRLGHARTVLKISCVDSQVLAAYAKDIRKTFGDGTTFEEDLRLSVRYVTDTELTPCAWNECGIEPSDAGTANVDHAFAATGLPVARRRR
jgi:DNA polymerase elongation subunit (family B)